jgi:hypothetical protein
MPHMRWILHNDHSTQICFHNTIYSINTKFNLDAHTTPSYTAITKSVHVPVCASELWSFLVVIHY